ncbi:MAG: hydroxyisourate hydrolase [Bdellovibrionia bacterium]
MKTSKSPVTTHILDTSRGRPASSVTVTLETQSPDRVWTHLSSEETDADGRIDNFPGLVTQMQAGIYRLTFMTEPYFKILNMETFYPSVTVIFQIRTPEKHYHVPLLINPFGYSTYRGT